MGNLKKNTWSSVELNLLLCAFILVKSGCFTDRETLQILHCKSGCQCSLCRRHRGTQREYSSKPLKHSIVGRIQYLNGRDRHIFIP